MRYAKRVVALGAVASLVLVACGSDDDGGSADTTAAAGTEAPAETSAPGETTAGTEGGATGEGLVNGEIPCDQQHEGKTVSVLSPVRNSENDPDAIGRFTDFWAPLAECTGVTIDFQGTDQFEVQAPVLLQGGSPPDVIDFPQPGLLRTLADSLITSLRTSPSMPAKTSSQAGRASTPSTVQIKGIPWRANVKSMVWYSPAAFEAGGYEVPETLEELTALSDQIVADGGTPWCAGIESGVATGWPITDWFEDFMLRINGPEVYDQWVAHEIPFNDPQVKAVADAVGGILKNADYMGGENNVKAIATTKFQDGGVPITTGDCYMHRQASFYNGLFPEGTVVGPPDDPAADVTYFYLPVAEEGDPRVMLGAGDLLSRGH